MIRAIAVLLATMVAPAAQDETPNVVLILTDDLGVNDLSCYGRNDHATPHLDALAAQGVRFTTAYAAQPICSASRAALMTGKCPARLHLTTFLPGRADAPTQALLQPVIEGQLPLEEFTLAELLHDAGYATACIGKWHLGGRGFGPGEQGFDVAFAGKAVTTPGPDEGSKGEFALTTAAEEFLESHRGRPFFLFLSHNTPHIPFAARPEDAAKHGAAFNPVYADVVARLDATVGRLLAKLAELELDERTIVVFTSDHGGLHVLESPGTPATHNTPFRAGKGYVYEGGLRVPLIVRWPGRFAPSLESTPVVLTDLVPTILEWCGVDPARVVGPLDGTSVAGLLRGDELSARRLFWHFPHYTNQGSRPAGAVLDGDWKLVEDYEDGSVELFDLRQDPGETNNVAAREPERTASLRDALHAWRLRVGAQECAPNPAFDAAAHGALYRERDPSRLAAGDRSAAEIALGWQEWRAAMDAAVRGRTTLVTPASGDIRLHADAAQVHGEQLQYEPQPMKRTLGYWVNADDHATWTFDVSEPGRYEVEIQQGCVGGGSEVAVEVAGQTLTFTVQDTGHFQHFILRTIGTVELPAGPQTLTVRPRSKHGVAIMDLRQITLR